MVRLALQREAWRVPECDSAILDTARDISRILREEDIRGAVVVGVAVGLHGHVRATIDVGVCVPAPLERFGEALRRHGYGFDARRREFRAPPPTPSGVPVHMERETGEPLGRRTEIDGITTVSLGDLISMKLRSGTAPVLRAQDLADVIALIRARKLTGVFTPRVAPDVRREFRRFVRAVRTEG